MSHHAVRVVSLGNGIECKPSTLPDDAGFGLFATRPFKKGSIITWYDGERISRNEALNRRKINKSSHIKSLNYLGDCIDGIKGESNMMIGRGGASLANDARSFVRNNCSYVTKNNNIYLKAKRDLIEGEELFVSYGKSYWSLRRLG
jgi:SET domain-containing protein